MLGSPMRHLLVHFLFKLFNCRKDGVNLHVLDCVLSHLAFENHALLLVLFLDSDAVFFQIFDYHRYAVIRVLIHKDIENPWLTVLYATPVHRNLIVGSETMINFLEGRKTAPCLQLGNILDFSVSLEHHQIMLRHYQVYVDHLLPHLSRLLALLSQL